MVESRHSDDVLQLGHHGHHSDSVMRSQHDQITKQMQQLTAFDVQGPEFESRRLMRKIFVVADEEQ